MRQKAPWFPCQQSGRGSGVDKRYEAPVDLFDYTRLTAYLDAACSTVNGQEAEERRTKARSILKDFFWKFKQDFRIIRSSNGSGNAKNSREDGCVEATNRLLSAYRLLYSGDGKPQEERDRRLAILAEIAAEAGLKDLRVRLRLFTQELAHVVLVSDDPLKKLKEILHGKAKRGPPKGAAQREIEIAAAVEERMRGGMTAKAAYDDVCRDKTVARQWKPPHNDGIRKIHEKMRTTGDGKKVAAPIVRLAATCNELRRKSKVKP
jgi:hypothetical protein